MSENTNTLFWVITGAAIVMSIYVLINTQIGGTIDGIFDNFDTIFTP